MTASQPPLQQIYVGGSGRSGTTVTGFILGRHPRIWNTLPREVRFISEAGGLLDLVLGAATRIQYGAKEDIGPKRTGRAKLREAALKVRDVQKPEDTDLAGFLEAMRGKWWYRLGPDGGPRGFHRGYKHEDYLEVVQRFADAYPADHEAAARGLISDLLDAKARKRGADAWVDTTPTNAENAHRITTLVPSAKVIHLVRDGRDTVSSVMTKNWGPNEPLDALRWWRLRTLRAHRSLGRCNPANVLTINMDDLITYDRDHQLGRLFEFLGYEIDEGVRTYFAEKVNGDRGNQGRWQKDIPAETLAEFDRTYREMWQELTAAGIPLRPL